MNRRMGTGIGRTALAAVAMSLMANSNAQAAGKIDPGGHKANAKKVGVDGRDKASASGGEKPSAKNFEVGDSGGNKASAAGKTINDRRSSGSTLRSSASANSDRAWSPPRNFTAGKNSRVNAGSAHSSG